MERIFTAIDNYILDSEELDGMEQILYTHLKKYSSSAGECFPGNILLCKKLKCSENTVRRLLKSLETKGLISIERRFNASNKYELLPFPKLQDELEEPSKYNETLVFHYYESNINPNLGALEKEKLTAWLLKFNFNAEVIIFAIKIAVGENVRKLSYIDVILRDWHKNEILTLEQAENYTKARVEKRKFGSEKKQDSFNAYEQRSYDYGELEKKLLGW